MSTISGPAPAHLRDVELGDQQPGAAAAPQIESQQPSSNQAMDPSRPHPESDLRLRGGDGGGCCPGRFCFCIPCPLPCNCCIIPL